MKQIIKQLLRITFKIVFRVSPGLADQIRERLYSFWYRFLSQNNKVSKTPLFRDRPGLLIDVSVVSKTDAGTGIQRVVNNIFRKLFEQTENVIAICDHFGQLITSNSYVEQKVGKEMVQEQVIEFKAGDSLLLLDSSWNFAADYSRFLKRASESEVMSYGVFYDLFPIQYPELFASPTFINSFCDWHNMLLEQSDSIICISRTTADVVAQYYEIKQFQRKYPLKLYYFHMGADVPGGSQVSRKEMQDFVKTGTVFLMVGTLEPRKGHMVVLNAFSKILRETQQECRLLIIGHDGWKNDEIRKELALPEFKDKILWIKDASDEELRWSYAHSDALIAASKDEGFGLPLVEAAHFGLPIICSDIPIFREVTQGNADYFKVMDADDLARCITAWLQTEKHPDSRNIRIYTWQESAQEILDIVDGKVKPYKVLK